jgi:hypothetical protein
LLNNRNTHPQLSSLKDSMFRQASIKLSAAPIGAVAITSVSSILLGRNTTTRTTTQVSNATTKHLHTWILNHHRKSVTPSPLVTNATNKYFRLNNPSNSINPSSSIFLSRRNLSSSTNKQQSGSFLQWYEGHLQANPVQTKMVSGSILWGLGDAVAQIVPAMFFDKEKSDKKEFSSMDLVYDYPRTARAMFYGFAIHAPLSHVHFNFLEWMTVRGGFTGLSIPVFKAFMEQVRSFFVCWVFESLKHCNLNL